jgi:hypothetical protein
MRKYICSLCKEEYFSVEEISNHLKSAEDEVHKGIDKNNLDVYFEVIDLDSREWTDISETVKRIKVPPISVMPSVPPELVPEGFVRIEDMPYYYKDKSYYCSSHKKTYDIENDFLMHVLAEHPRDFDRVLKFIVKRSLLSVSPKMGLTRRYSPL